VLHVNILSLTMLLFFPMFIDRINFFTPPMRTLYRCLVRNRHYIVMTINPALFTCFIARLNICVSAGMDGGEVGGSALRAAAS
jgi:hypothetical protein